ncbi:MAG: hypothetical protein JKY15_00600, partial [Deltaproteobacteria bacterium]|nr:hypothetical protein [Deltaproteobacteria bacterium]
MIIFFGGESPERLVSVATAQNISQAVPEADCYFWAQDNSVFKVKREALLVHENPFKSEFKPSASPVAESPKRFFEQVREDKPTFILGTHGGKGEDGTLQDWLESYNLAHTGPDSTACRLAINKTAGKELVAKHGVRVLPSILLQHDKTVETLNQCLEAHQKLILKPNFGGSSIGL